jgi:tetratricopeptide (TPR) repeat protein
MRLAMTDLFSARRFKVIPLAAVILACVLAASSSAEARDIYKECNGGNDTAGIVEACSSVLRRGSLESTSNRKQAFFYRGYAYQRTNRLDESFADYRAALTIDPGYFAPKNNLAVGLANRGNEASHRKDYGQALTDFAEALKLKPNDVLSLNNLAAIHYKEGDFGRAIPLCTLAIQNDPKSTTAYDICGRSYLGKGDLKNAVVALTKVQALDPGRKDDDESQSPQQALDQANRMLAEAAPAVVPSRSAVEPAVVAPVVVSPVVAPAERSSPGEIRVALVIGNSHYANVGALSNPRQDAALVADALKKSGFTSVTLLEDLGRDGFVSAIKTFQDQADKADWAAVYYAGHGVEVDGTNYLIPVDAKLKSDRDVPDETIPLDRVMSAIEGAHKLKLVVLDACRNNPFAPQMKLSGAHRSISRGLTRVEPVGATLVVYAAKEGTTAQDGDGADSPFAASFARRLEQPGVEINMALRFVRQDVLDQTGNQQEPFVYGSLPPTNFYFVPPK